MIVLISESLLMRATATDGRILRDRMLSGFGVRLNARKRTFLVATSVRGQQFRMMLGYWPLMSVEEARSKAMEVLRKCRNGERPSRRVPQDLPTLREAYGAYCSTKGIKASSQRRYESFYRTHFGAWLDQPVDNHTAPKTDVLNRHYVGLTEFDVTQGLITIQTELDQIIKVDH